MKDIDQIALAVEAECNSTVRNNVEKVTRMQDRINEHRVIIIQNLAERNMDSKRHDLGAEPYKCDNAKLIRECNELHLA
ncbi:hypothetical protein NQ318_005578 [Aromia moschata]|uniref:Tektin n=1 Tax=Aromia moschata TaxID=1265417 RepID=A0AAV8XJX1_9CUCU|nr:hypothetical protein NQ318_005578 [Aromia moschata]